MQIREVQQMKDKRGMTPSLQRWSAGRKVELILALLRGQKTMVDAAREHGLSVSEIEQWKKSFVESGERGLRINAKDQKMLHEQELKEHRAKIGELALEVDILKKAKNLLEEDENLSYGSSINTGNTEEL